MDLFMVSHIFSPVIVRNSLGQLGSFSPGIRWTESSLVPVWSILFATSITCWGQGLGRGRDKTVVTNEVGWEESGILELEYIILNIFLKRLKER